MLLEIILYSVIFQGHVCSLQFQITLMYTWTVLDGCFLNVRVFGNLIPNQNFSWEENRWNHHLEHWNSKIFVGKQQEQK